MTDFQTTQSLSLPYGERRSRLAVLNNHQLPPNMVSSTPERLKTALVALQMQARSASDLIGCFRTGNEEDNLKSADVALDRLRSSQEVMKVMPRECFIIVEAARLLGKPIPDVSVQDLAFTGLIALDFIQ
ncbi:MULTISPECIES: hypothetical protein [unclassified Pseudomonas]|uniref:hypothetical protein n=1 Tax=unclassified Pseudomonas TaxID=196821 RepID=UPI000C2FC460|nr:MULTISPECIES: hypothetical protein [unclassified Pseudomonas]MCU1737544.1 hypothetical protein [Pseudomonas sp. 20S_6.2_Bac1]